jgi:glycosyltransferase involved in cell wall biosynthesis
MKTLLVEGWRGLSQSLAMVNQYQLLELAKSPMLSIFHADLPYFLPRWTMAGNDPGFSPSHWTSISSIPKPGHEQFDAVYRIGFPWARSATNAKRVVTFIVTELGLSAENFAAGSGSVESFCSGDDLITTPSSWSKMKLLEYGFPPDKVHVVPHGVNSEIFFPLSPQERQEIRNDLELSNDHFVFLNVGALTLNKGVDCLLLAFQRVRQHYENARLVLKDSSSLYGTTIADFIRDHTEYFGPLLRETLDSIYVVPSSLSLQEMRLLYGGADSYVSPYTAEGFNLPVIEAIACGTPAIVTKGGATDDFCDNDTALMIKSDQIANKDRECHIPGYRLEPQIDDVAEQMELALTGNGIPSQRFQYGRGKLIEKFTWASAAQQLEAIL